MEKLKTTHEEELPRLKKIEGQIRGIHRMIEAKKYCVDILNQLSAVSGAIMKVEERILTRHLRGCVQRSLTGEDPEDRDRKIQEIITLIAKFRK